MFTRIATLALLSVAFVGACFAGYVAIYPQYLAARHAPGNAIVPREFAPMPSESPIEASKTIEATEEK